MLRKVFREILTHPETSQPLPEQVEVELQTFSSRFAAAEYLHRCLQGMRIAEPERDVGLWAWLALFYFDEVCPISAGNRRRVGERARYIPDVNNFQRYYRHLIAGPYLILRAHRDQPDRAMALLCGPVDKPGDVVEQFASRQELVTSPTVMSSITRLYYDPQTGQLRRGAGGRGRGTCAGGLQTS